MPLIDDATREQIRQRLAQSLAEPVEIRLYRRPDSGRLVLPGGLGCATCDAAEEIARTLVEAAPGKLTLRVTDVTVEDSDIEATPTYVVGAPDEEGRITFQGLPAGYEFTTLLDAIERVSGRGHELAPDVAERVRTLEDDVELMVFVTPSCPYCPGAGSMANRMALASPRIRSIVVEANEFPELADRFQVQGVPRTVVNRAGAFVGALPEAMFVDSVLKLSAQEVA
jgi:glutaredoxin-like protein